MKNVLEADSINLTFSNRRILSDIYLRCETGDIIGLIGRNGVGKSSLMKIIFGSLKGDNQSVRVNGKYSNCMYKEKHRISYLPQDEFLMNYLNFNEILQIFSLDPIVLEVPEVRKIAKTKIGILSSGQKRLIEVLTILFSPSNFILLDEPFSFLSPKLVELLVPIIKKRAQSKGIIISDHQYESIFRTCDKYYLMRNESLKMINERSDLYELGYLSIKQAEAGDMAQ